MDRQEHAKLYTGGRSRRDKKGDEDGNEEGKEDVAKKDRGGNGERKEMKQKRVEKEMK